MNYSVPINGKINSGATYIVSNVYTNNTKISGILVSEEADVSNSITPSNIIVKDSIKAVSKQVEGDIVLGTSSSSVAQWGFIVGDINNQSDLIQKFNDQYNDLDTGEITNEDLLQIIK